MDDKLQVFIYEITRVYKMLDSIVEAGDTSVYIDEDGSDIMNVVNNEDGSKTFEFLLCDKKFLIKRGGLVEL